MALDNYPELFVEDGWNITHTWYFTATFPRKSLDHVNVYMIAAHRRY
jgi:hypothetical protein